MPMPPLPTTSASTRRRAVPPLSTGRRGTRRTSRTVPRGSPSGPTTSRSSSSLRRIVAGVLVGVDAVAGNVGDDVVAGPPLGPPCRQFPTVGGQAHAAVDVADPPRGDPRVLAGTGQLLQPRSDASPAQSFGEHARPGQEVGELEIALVGEVELEVVDLAAVPAGAVDELVIEQRERPVQGAVRAHWPALVAIMSGMAAMEIT